MTTQIFKVIIAGILLGTAIFLMPFILLRIFLIVLIFRLIFRLLGHRRWRGRHNGFQYAFARRWAHMTEEEKKSFRDKMENDYFSKMNK